MIQSRRDHGCGHYINSNNEIVNFIFFSSSGLGPCPGTSPSQGLFQNSNKLERFTSHDKVKVKLIDDSSCLLTQIDGLLNYIDASS